MRWADDPFREDQHVIGDSGVIDGPLDDDGEDEWSSREQHEESPSGAAVVVYVPSERVDGGVGPDTKVQLRYLEDGLLALPLFSSLEQLIADCGEGQPWVAVPAERVEEFRHIVGADLAVLDPVMPTEQ